MLEGIVCQSLLPKANGEGRVVALEILVPHAGIRNLIREDKVHQIYSAMQAGQEKLGMQTMNQSLATLYSARHDHARDGDGRLVDARRAAGDDQPRRRRRAGRRDEPARPARPRPLVTPVERTRDAQETTTWRRLRFRGRTRGGETIKGERTADSIDAVDRGAAPRADPW